MNILLTGSVGFIGANLVMRLLKDDVQATIVGLDNLNSYYDVSLKEYRLQQIDKVVAETSAQSRWLFVK